MDERAEHALLRSLDIAVHRFPRRHVETTLHRPLRFGDEFDLELAGGANRRNVDHSMHGRRGEATPSVSTGELSSFTSTPTAAAIPLRVRALLESLPGAAAHLHQP